MARALILLTAVFVGLVAGCSDETIVRVDPRATVAIHLDHTVDGVSLEMNQLVYTNPAGTPFSVTRLQYVVSDVHLIDADGDSYGMSGIHYRKASPDPALDAATRVFAIEGVPSGTYEAITFLFGLDEARNVAGRFASDARFESDMFWPPPLGGNAGLGYHYMKLEGEYRDDQGATFGFTTHTGARQCNSSESQLDCGPLGPVDDPVPHHHFFRVVLPMAPTVIDGDEWDVTVRMDVNGWYRDGEPADGYDSSLDWKDLPMQLIMANLDAQQKLMTNGPHAFSASIAPAP